MRHSHHGLRWLKLDLHVHTPASADFSGAEVTAEHLVARALMAELDGLAVTDHNSGAWVDPVIAAARPTNLVVFPGVEVTASGGQGGIHIVALFDCTEDSKTIEALLAKLEIPPKLQGRTDTVSPRSPLEVIETIAAMGGLAILAHADSSKGVLHDMKGQPRLQILNSPDLSAAELCNPAKNARFLDGSDPEYRRRVAVYRASDNRTPVTDAGHSLEGIGSRFSWFKMDGITLTALSQCFCDPEVRIILDTASDVRPERMYPRILRVGVSHGFLQSSSFEFHEGLNSIIGGKGVGKSLLVELIRFALNQPSPVAIIRDDMESKLKVQLGVGGVVTVEVQLEDDRTLVIERTYDGIDNPTRITCPQTGADVHAHIDQLFPVLAYSQTEALEIARYSGAQLQLIDSLVDLASLQQEVSDTRDILRRSDAGLVTALTAESVFREKERAVATLEEQVAQLERALKSPKHDELQRLAPKTQSLADLTDYLHHIENCVIQFREELNAYELDEAPQECKQDVELQARYKEVTTLATSAARQAEQLGVEITKATTSIDASRKAWEKKVNAATHEYRVWADAQGGNRAQLLAKKKTAEAALDLAKRAARAAKTRAEKLPLLRSERARMLEALDKSEQTIHTLRKAKYLEIQEGSNGRLRLELVRDGDVTAYTRTLIALKKGSNLYDATVEQVAKTTKPRDLVRFVITGDAKGLANVSGIMEKQAERFVQYLGAIEAFDEVLALEHQALCRDLPRILYRKDDGVYHELSELSVGQKCSALLVIAMAEGIRPVIIDQPEDALDTPSVYDDVTMHLRVKKATRQFVLTTHNSTVAVASDTDEFHVLSATASTATLRVHGAMDKPKVLAEVIQHLEGGETPFELKRRKYSRNDLLSTN